jgi:hypothetical protein
MTLYDNDEALSRILSAHASGQLVAGGRGESGDNPGCLGCIIEVGLCEPFGKAWDYLGVDYVMVDTFDIHYDPNWTPEKLLEKINNWELGEFDV